MECSTNEYIWKTLIYQGIQYDNFEVSTNGKLRNVKTGTIYKTTILPTGYEAICISLGSRNQKKSIRIHRAVAETFIPNPENKPVINHMDGNKLNNDVSNLEWVTFSENTRHAVLNGLQKGLPGENNPNAKLTQDDVQWIREHYIKRSKEYGSRALGKKFSVDHSVILDIINYTTYV